MMDVLKKVAARLPDNAEVWGVYIAGVTGFKKTKDSWTMLPHGDLDDSQLATFPQFVELAIQFVATKAAGLSMIMSDPKQMLQKRKQAVFTFLDFAWCGEN